MKQKSVYDNSWISVRHDEVIKPDGNPGIYGVVHFKNLAVGILALDDRDQLLMVGQYRYPLERYSWEIPEGGSPLGEAPLETAKRELEEETGFSATHWEVVFEGIHLSNSVSDEAAYCYLATGFTPGVARPEGSERLEVKWMPFNDVLAAIQRGEVTDALTILGVQRLALRRLKR